MRRRLMKWLIRFVVVASFVFALIWGGIWYYFSHVNRIADQVRQSVQARLEAENSRLLNYDEIPKMYVNAVIATEDRTFFSNMGIDPIGIVRSAYVDVQKDKYAQGGSTITQQLVHNALLSGYQKSVAWKAVEAVYALGLFDTMTKKETFALYANDIYFGQGAYGLYDAGLTYFGKPPNELNDGELAMLAGLPNAPSLYDPFYAMPLARERQKIVLMSMVDAGMMTSSQANQILKEPIQLKQ